MSMDIIAAIAEKRIEEAMENGYFDDLPGSGKPLELEDDSMIPPELRMAYKILKNSGFAPPEVELRKQIGSIESLLERSSDEKARLEAIKKLEFLLKKLSENGHAARLQNMPDEYYSRILEMLEKRK